MGSNDSTTLPLLTIAMLERQRGGMFGGRKREQNYAATESLKEQISFLIQSRGWEILRNSSKELTVSLESPGTRSGGQSPVYSLSYTHWSAQKKTTLLPDGILESEPPKTPQAIVHIYI